MIKTCFPKKKSFPILCLWIDLGGWGQDRKWYWDRGLFVWKENWDPGQGSKRFKKYKIKPWHITLSTLVAYINAFHLFKYW